MGILITRRRMFYVFLILLAFLTFSLCFCPAGYTPISDVKKCIKLNQTAVPAVIAEARCQQEGGHLASVPHGFFNVELKRYLVHNNISGMVQLGLERTSSSESWTWKDGENVTYTNWASGQPTLIAGCGAMSVNGFWYSTNCNKPLQFFCELDEHLGCESRWSEYNRTCYNFQNSDAYSAAEAERNCVRKGAHLASIHSDHENAKVSSYLAVQNYCGVQWLGLQCSSGKFSWTDGSLIDYVPNELQSCTVRQYAMNVGACGLKTGTWDLNPVIEPLSAWVCKTSPPCRADWTFAGGACYLLTESSVQRTFQSAESLCVEQDSHMVSIHSAEENKIVAELIQWSDHCDMMWIGMKCSAGQPAWTDGSVVDYLNGDVDCTSMFPYEMYAGRTCYLGWPSTGSWVIASSTQRYSAYVCKKPISYN